MLIRTSATGKPSTDPEATDEAETEGVSDGVETDGGCGLPESNNISGAVDSVASTQTAASKRATGTEFTIEPVAFPEAAQDGKAKPSEIRL